MQYRVWRVCGTACGVWCVCGIVCMVGGVSGSSVIYGMIWEVEWCV